MKFPYRGWFNLRGNRGKKRIKRMTSATLWDQIVVVILVVWIAYVIWRTVA